jgi:transcriptional regulator with XRE-family HTH domain
MNLRKDKIYQHHSPYTQRIGEKKKQTHYPQDQAESFGSPRARYWRELKEIQKYSGSPGRRAKLALLEGKLTTKVKEKLLDVGSYLKQKLKEANLNVQKLAELTGLKETTIAHYFRTDFSGQALPDKNTWDILKPILNLGNYEDFINEEIRNALPNPHPLGKNPGDVWEIPYHPKGDETIHGQRLPPQPNQKGAFHFLGKNPGDL